MSGTSPHMLRERPEEDRKCSKCKRLQPPEVFPFITRGTANCGRRTRNCKTCSTASKNYKRARQEDKENLSPDGPVTQARKSVDESLPVCSLDELLLVLVNRRNVLNIEAAVNLSAPDAPRELADCRTKANYIAEQIGESMGYFFRYHSEYKSKKLPQLRLMFHCAQNKDRQELPEKTPNPLVQRDKLPMDAFDCEGWLHITICDSIQSISVRLEHKEDHIPYYVIAIPPEIKTMIILRKKESVAQIWNDIIKENPSPKFSRRSVYTIWSKVNETDWKRDNNPLISVGMLMQEAEQGNLGREKIHIISLPTEPGFTTIAWCLPDILARWGGRIREVAMDSAWETNGANFELYALLGEAYGTGLPIGFFLLASEGGAAGGIERHLTPFLQYFKNEWGLEPMLGLSDKNVSEINSMLVSVSKNAHQLCFWHNVTAVKKRLSTLRRLPAYYNVQNAMEEYTWINPKFMPVGQAASTGVPITEFYIPQSTLPRITVRFNGQICDVPVPKPIVTPSQTQCPPSQRNKTRGFVSPPPPFNLNADEAEEFHRFWNQVEEEVGPDNEPEEENAPDWMFEEGEHTSKDKEYVFCPAPHRRQLLQIFIKHFCLHPFFPDANGHFQTSPEIRDRAVHEMYQFCYARGLCEVWGYMWTSWYQPKRWKLWARSADKKALFLSRWRTTMGAENFWHQLKHDYLHHLVRPRIDHLFWIIHTQVYPNYLLRSQYLEDVWCLGRPRKMTAFQTRFKAEWKRLSEVPTSGRNYDINIEQWTCTCGAMKYNSFHVCKHLVQAIPYPPPSFWREIIRRRVMPLYQHPVLRHTGQPENLWLDPDLGSVSDGDDHVFLGHKMLLTNGNWRELIHDTNSVLGKRCASSITDPSSDAPSSEAACNDIPESYNDDSDNFIPSVTGYITDSEDENETTALKQEAIRILAQWEKGVDIIRNQIENGSTLWLRSFVNGVGKSVDHFTKTIDQVESTRRTRKTTWARNNIEAKAARHTMGYKLSDKKSKNL